MHFTDPSYVTGYYGIDCVRILSLLTKVGESVNGRQYERKESKSFSLQQWNKQQMGQINGLGARFATKFKKNR